MDLEGKSVEIPGYSGLQFVQSVYYLLLPTAHFLHPMSMTSLFFTIFGDLIHSIY